MKLASFSHKQKIRIGAIIDNEIVDCLDNSDIPQNMIDFLAAGNPALTAMQNQIDSGRHRLALNDITLLAPVPKPGKFLGVSLNYADHIEETGREKPEFPTFFNKQSTCVIGPEMAIHQPKVSEKLDYEGELAFIIGKRCRYVSEEKTHEVIAGFTIANDVSVRDWQIRSPTMTLGKSFDTHGPTGPWIVTTDEVENPHNLNLRTWVDDDLRQDSNTRNMIFNCYQLVAYLSTVMTLEPGDMITTGTPRGVGVKMKPRGYLRPGQTVKIVIEKIGTLENPVIKEPVILF